MKAGSGRKDQALFRNPVPLAASTGGWLAESQAPVAILQRGAATYPQAAGFLGGGLVKVGL